MTSRVEWNLITQCLATPADIARCRQLLVDGGTIDWLAVAALANDNFVGPALWTILSHPQLRDAVPEDARDYLKLIHARNAERNAKIRQQCMALGAVLASAGLCAVLLKGVTWLFDRSGAPAEDRMMRDIDLLVAASDVKAAVDALLAAGYQDSGQAFLEDGHLHFEQHGHFHHAPLVPLDGEAIVEVHQDIAYRTDFLPARDMIAASTQVAPGLLLPALRHRILHNVIHSQVSNSDRLAGRFDLRDGLDLARLADAGGAGFDWAALADEARRKRFFSVLSGAIHATHRILGSPLPPAFAADRWGRLHGWRCDVQRRQPLLARPAALLGSLQVAFTWDRDAYAIGLGGRRTLKDRLRVNLRRGLRLSLFAGRWARRLRSRPGTPS